jgi:lysozyme family protein
MNLTDSLRAEYRSLWKYCSVRPERGRYVQQYVTLMRQNRMCYENVEVRTTVPWEVVGVIHLLEAGGKFDRHLHNGDPLTARTVNHPAGRPIVGEPPFQWVESAEDALVHTPPYLGRWRDWSLAGTLWKLESYNGLGYRKYHPTVLSPYLWAGSYHYSKGKYVADGKWSDTAVSKQIGAAVILRQLPEARFNK